MPKQKRPLKNKNKNILLERETKKVVKFKGWLEENFHKALPNFHIDTLKLGYRYMERNQPIDNNSAVMSINYLRSYRRAVISVYPFAYEMYRKGRLEELKEGIYHELSHIHTWALSEIAQDRFASKKEVRHAVEELTEIISRYVIKNSDINKR